MSRQAAPDRQFGEVRALFPVEVLSILDARCSILAKRKGRTVCRGELLNQIVLEWARQEEHEATVMSNAIRGNPALSDLEG